MCEIAYAEFLVGECMHDPQPQRIRQRQEHLDRGRRRLFGRQGRANLPHRLRVHKLWE